MARILVVDDQRSDRFHATGILEDAGHDVFCAEDAEEGVRVYLSVKVDVVITALQLAKGDGFELIAMLRVLLPQPPVIALSGVSGSHSRLAQELGASATLHKPVDSHRLLEAVQTAISDSALGAA